MKKLYPTSKIFSFTFLRFSSLTQILISSILYINFILIIVPVCSLKTEYSSKPENYNILSWEKAYEKAKNYLDSLPLENKISLLFGTENMYLTNENKIGCEGKIDPFMYNDTENNIIFNGMCLQNGPAGVRFAKGTSLSWQSPLNTACTFDKNLAYQIGKMQGNEFYIKGINAVLSPNLNIMRSPLAGRGWEGFGDDPYLIGVMGTQIIKGLQDSGVIAVAKNYVAGDQELFKKAAGVTLDVINLWENYIRPFIRAINFGDVGGIMVAFNAINGTYLHKNKLLINDYLKEKIEFKGFVVSNWWAIYDDDTDYINSGIDMNMPGGKKSGKNFVGRNESYWYDLMKHIKRKSVSENRINDAATRIIATMYKFNQMDNFNSVNLSRDTFDDEKIKLHRKAAADSNVLLRNKDNILPIDTKKIKKITILGSDAFERDCEEETDFNCYSGRDPIYRGHSPLGYGSSSTDFKYLITPFEGISNRAKKYNIKIAYYKNLTQNNEEDIENAIKESKDSDLILIFGNAVSGEEYIRSETSCGDRFSLHLMHNIDRFIEEISKINNNIVVIIHSSGPVHLPWIRKVKGIIYAGYPGMESGNAIADILFGDVNPSGHLPFVWGRLEDYCCRVVKTKCNMTNEYERHNRFDGSPNMAPFVYNEGLFIGQRYFERERNKPIFHFGFGLSYTEFEFKDLKVEMKKEGLYAKVNVFNVGNYDGSTVVFLFLTFPREVRKYPQRMFKGFEKVFVKKGENIECEIFVDSFALSYYSLVEDDFVRPRKGEYIVYVGSSAGINDLNLTATVNADF